MKKKFKLAKSVAIAYFVYSMVTDIAIWTTALLYFINKGFQPFKNAACEDAKNLDFSGFLARGRQQQCDDDAFGVACASIRAKPTVVKSFLRVWGKLNQIGEVFLHQQQCDDDVEKSPCASIPATGSRVKSFLHVWRKLFVIRQVCATGQ